ncbi:DEKNAAC105651 [Brettanomyces naardenensis]|uniref:DEKNAAC105651 n=1 Tax=Brettanomyces naardenensis TaxID=13370 RepID=A0A448YTT6_BRENA|nr:DEKNAAC105651 [Brettanomyces naardenensis]
MSKIVPTATEYNTGQVVVRKGSGTVKVRKGQTEEEFLEQKNRFLERGPVVSNAGSFSDLLKDISLDDRTVRLDKLDKIPREKIFQDLERLYYMREYTICQSKAKALGAQMDIPEGTDLKVKKNRNLGRIVEFLHDLEERCERRLMAGGQK